MITRLLMEILTSTSLGWFVKRKSKGHHGGHLQDDKGDILECFPHKLRKKNWGKVLKKEEFFTSKKVLGGFGGIVLDPNTSCLCSKSLFSPLSPEASEVFSFRAISWTPPKSCTFWTPSAPRLSMSSLSCLRVTPYLLPAAMMAVAPRPGPSEGPPQTWWLRLIGYPPHDIGSANTPEN